MTTINPPSLSKLSAEEINLERLFPLLLEEINLRQQGNSRLSDETFQSIIDSLSLDRLYQEGFLTKDLDPRIIYLILERYQLDNSAKGDISMFLWPYLANQTISTTWLTEDQLENPLALALNEETLPFFGKITFSRILEAIKGFLNALVNFLATPGKPRLYRADVTTKLVISWQPDYRVTIWSNLRPLDTFDDETLDEVLMTIIGGMVDFEKIWFLDEVVLTPSHLDNFPKQQLFQLADSLEATLPQYNLKSWDDFWKTLQTYQLVTTEPLSFGWKTTCQSAVVVITVDDYLHLVTSRNYYYFNREYGLVILLTFLLNPGKWFIQT